MRVLETLGQHEEELTKGTSNLLARAEGLWQKILYKSTLLFPQLSERNARNMFPWHELVRLVQSRQEMIDDHIVIFLKDHDIVAAEALEKGMVPAVLKSRSRKPDLLLRG